MHGDQCSIDDARAAKLVRQVRELVAAGALDFSRPHCRQRMQERGITLTQILAVAKEGEPDGNPRRDQYGCWRIRLTATPAGKRVRVVFAVLDDEAVVVTVI